MKFCRKPKAIEEPQVVRRFSPAPLIAQIAEIAGTTEDGRGLLRKIKALPDVVSFLCLAA